MAMLASGLALALGGLASTTPSTIAGKAIGDGRRTMSGATDDAVPLDASATLTANCRYGLAAWSPYADFIAVQNTGMGWYLDFNARTPIPDPLPGAEFVQVVKVLQDRNDVTGYYSPTFSVDPPLNASGLGALVQANPGALWIIGNEPDRGPNVPTDTNRVQDDTFAPVYAKAYHDAYQFIKSRDAAAQVAVAGLVEVTPGRLNYLDQMWQSYQTTYGVTMPVDVWNMHLYVLPEANHWGTGPDDIASVAKGTPLALARRENLGLDFSLTAQQNCNNSQYVCWADHDDVGEFSAQIVAMRSWMKSKGQQNKPLIISEFGILYPDSYDTNPDNPYHCWVVDEFGHCFTPSRVSQFLHKTFEYLNTAQDPAIGYPLDNNRLVQQWLWFSVNFPIGYVSNIVTPTVPMTFTMVGNQFKTDVTNPISYPQNINLFPSSTRGLGAIPNGATTTVMASVDIMNNGSIVPSAPVTITVYADAARTQPMGSATVSGGRGCARKAYPTVVTWSLPATVTGVLTYYVRVDPGNLAGETTMSDNDIDGTVFVGSNRLLLPAVMR